MKESRERFDLWFLRNETRFVLCAVGLSVTGLAFVHYSESDSIEGTFIAGVFSFFYVISYVFSVALCLATMFSPYLKNRTTIILLGIFLLLFVGIDISLVPEPMDYSPTFSRMYESISLFFVISPSLFSILILLPQYLRRKGFSLSITALIVLLVIGLDLIILAFACL